MSMAPGSLFLVDLYSIVRSIEDAKASFASMHADREHQRCEHRGDDRARRLNNISHIRASSPFLTSYATMHGNVRYLFASGPAQLQPN